MKGDFLTNTTQAGRETTMKYSDYREILLMKMLKKLTENLHSNTILKIILESKNRQEKILMKLIELLMPYQLSLKKTIMIFSTLVRLRLLELTISLKTFGRIGSMN